MQNGEPESGSDGTKAILGAAAIGIALGSLGLLIFKGEPPSKWFGSSTELSTETRAEPRTSMEDLLRKEMSDLDQVDRYVDWWEVERNNIYIGFHTLPDVQTFIRTTALRGNRAINFGCHVWAVYRKPKGWRPSGKRERFWEVTARHGKIQ